MKTLYLKQVNYPELCTKWGYKPYAINTFLVLKCFENGVAYIRARKNGTVNWDIAPVYKPSELKGRLVFIHI